MDALALLCNLYGDGPATLKRLRSAGCASFDALGGLDAADLAEILGTSQPAARRFLREARLLLERVDVRELEVEERPPLAGVDRSSAPEPPVDDITTVESFGAEPVEDTPPGVAPPEVPLAERAQASSEEADVPLIDKVLQTWRERDARVGAEHDVEFDDADEAVTAAEAAQEQKAVGTPLRPRIVDGLDRGWCERLRESGVETLEQLAGAEALELSQRISAGLTQLMRLQFLARRLISERGEVETPEPPDMLRPVARPWPATPSRGATPPRTSELITGPHPPSKFSASEAPFGVATSSLARELDEASGRVGASEDPPPPPPYHSGFEEGSGGPFAR